MRIQDMLLMIVAVSVVGLGMASFTQELAEPYGVSVNTSFSETYDHLNEMGNNTETLRTKIIAGELVSVEGFTALFNGAISILKLALNALALPFDIFFNVTSSLGLPDWALVAVDLMLVIVIVFTIVNLIMGAGRA